MARAARVLARPLLVLLLAAVSPASLSMAAELVFDLKIAHGRVADTMRLIRVTEGDIVRLRWTTDRPLVLHLHGYDIEKRVVPGRVTEMAFTAKATGRFPVEIHGQGGGGHDEAPLVNVEVYPH